MTYPGAGGAAESAHSGALRRQQQSGRQIGGRKTKRRRSGTHSTQDPTYQKHGRGLSKTGSEEQKKHGQNGRRGRQLFQDF